MREKLNTTVSVTQHIMRIYITLKEYLERIVAFIICNLTIIEIILYNTKFITNTYLNKNVI